MSMPGYDETLVRFGLTRLKAKADLCLTPEGNIAITRDGHLQMGNVETNAMFRFVERWRQSESTINDLFSPMFRAAKKLDEFTKARQMGQGPSLVQDAHAYHEVTETMIEAQLVSSTLAGSIFVVLDSLLQRLRLDLGLNLLDIGWVSSLPMIRDRSLGPICQAAAANFRHYDEWAARVTPSSQQLSSLEVLCALLGCSIQTEQGRPSIRTNVCGQVLMMVSGGSLDQLHEMTFQYAKALAKH